MTRKQREQFQRSKRDDVARAEAEWMKMLRECGPYSPATRKAEARYRRLRAEMAGRQ